MERVNKCSDSRSYRGMASLRMLVTRLLTPMRNPVNRKAAQALNEGLRLAAMATKVHSKTAKGSADKGGKMERGAPSQSNRSRDRT